MYSSNLRSRSISCWVLTLLLMYSHTAWAVQNSIAAVYEAGAAVENPRSSYGGDASAIFDRVEAIRERVDRTQFEIDELVFALNFDAEEILQFVSEEIRYQHYQGLLRSAEGTLIARAGNSLDQATLLARLMNDAGFEARIVQGVLSPEETSRLKKTMFGEFAWPETFDNSSDDFLSRTVAFFSPELSNQHSISELAEQMIEQRRETASIIEALSERLNKELSSVAVAQTQATLDIDHDSRKYFWVEYRSGAGSQWTAVHPAFGESEKPEVKAERYLVGSIPDSLQHRVRIEVFLQSEIGGSKEVHALMPAWERPAANAAYMPLNIAFLPYLASGSNPEKPVEEALGNAELFIAYFNDQPAAGGKVFSLDGRVLPPEAMSSAGEFVKTASDKGITAISALSGLGAKENGDEDRSRPLKLGKIWIEYTLVSPSGEEKSIERVVVEPEIDTPEGLDAEGSDEAEKRQLRARLMQLRSLTLATGQVNPNFLAYRMADAVQTSRSALDILKARLVDQGATTAAALEGLEPLPETLWMEYFMTANTQGGISPTQVSYLHEPMLVSFNRGVSETKGQVTSYKQVDILSNSRLSFRLEDERLEPAPILSLQQGIYESMQELRVLQADRPDRVSSAFSALKHAEDFSVVAPGSAAAELTARVKPEYRSIAEREIDAGYALMIPESNPDAGWWRVDLSTGSVAAMGMGPGGYGGAAAAEYLKVLGLIVGAMFTLYNVVGCFKEKSGLELYCCLAASILIGVMISLFMMLTAKLILIGLTSASAAYATTASGVVLSQASAASMRAVAALINLAYTGVAVRFIPMKELRDRACGAITS